MLLHLARLSVITIALALVGGLGFLLARPTAPAVVTVVVPAQQPVVQPAYVYPYWGCYGSVCLWR